MAPIRRDDLDDAGILGWIGAAGVDDGYVSYRSHGIFDERGVGGSVVGKEMIDRVL